MANNIKPKFMGTDEEYKITGAQKGTLMHLCLKMMNEMKCHEH